LGIEADRSTLAILPGSRPSELSRLMPTLVKAAEKLAESHPSLQVVVPVAPTLDRARVASYFEGRKVNAVLIDGRAAEVVGASDAAIVCSGTATLEAGLMLRPFAVVYKVSPLSEIIYRLLVRVAHYSLINLLAGEPLVPELIQRQCSADRIAREIGEFFEDGAARDRMIRGLARIRDSLGAPGASARAAEAVVSLVDRMARRPPGARTVRAETTSGI
jgi:lipid-A-disaccharide synthase